MERVKGIEPSYAAWEAAVLPLNYTRAGGSLRIVRHGRRVAKGRRPEKLGRQDADELIGLPQLLRQVE